MDRMMEEEENNRIHQNEWQLNLRFNQSNFFSRWKYSIYLFFINIFFSDEQSQISSIDINLSPSGSTESDSSTRSSINSCQLCRCPSNDCVIHHRHSNEIPEDLRSDRNPTYGSNNLLLHYAHLERCRRYGTNLHLSSSSSS